MISLANRANLRWQRDPEESVPLPVSVPRWRIGHIVGRQERAEPQRPNRGGFDV
jgi:hypothetical protein